MILWCLWKKRNEMLWNNTNMSVENVIFMALSMLNDWLIAKNIGQRATITDVHEVSDIGWNAKEGFVACRIMTQVGVVSPKEAEVLGLAEAIRWTPCMGWLNVVFETNAKNVVDSIPAKRQDVTEYGMLISSCKELLNHVNGYSV
ncbi:hypothetical protein DITRI_Ditri18aG0125100 [Diplodiscus trichospermus]